MKQETRDDLYQRSLTALQGCRPEGDAASATVDVQHYLDPQRFAAELALFRRFPQPLAASAELPEAGDWLARDRFGMPFLLVRQDDGSVRALLNVCRHRGARLVEEGAGKQARTFVCPYHAWSYNSDGSLRGVPQSFGFPCLDKEACELRRLAVRERAGLIWVVPDPHYSDLNVDQYLGPLMDELESLDLATPAAFAPRSYEVAANWKLLIDGAFEAYHFKVAHRNTIAAMFTDNMQLVDEIGLNRRLYLLKANFSAEHPPALDDFEPRQYGNIIYFFFPNTTLLVQPDHTQFSTLEPIAPGVTRVHEITLLPTEPDSAKAEKYWQANVDLYRRTLAEDYTLAESIHKGLPSGANSALTFGTFEFSVPRFHSQLQDQLRDQPQVR